MKIICPFKPKSPYRAVIEELSRRAGVKVEFVRKLPAIKGFTVLLDPRGSDPDPSLFAREDATFVVGGPDGIDIDADERVSLGNYVVNHQIALIILLDLIFRAKNPEHPYNRH